MVAARAAAALATLLLLLLLLLPARPGAPLASAAAAAAAVRAAAVVATLPLLLSCPASLSWLQACSRAGPSGPPCEVRRRDTTAAASASAAAADAATTGAGPSHSLVLLSRWRTIAASSSTSLVSACPGGCTPTHPSAPKCCCRCCAASAAAAESAVGRGMYVPASHAAGTVASASRSSGGWTCSRSQEAAGCSACGLGVPPGLLYISRLLRGVLPVGAVSACWGLSVVLLHSWTLVVNARKALAGLLHRQRQYMTACSSTHMMRQKYTSGRPRQTSPRNGPRQAQQPGHTSVKAK